METFSVIFKTGSLELCAIVTAFDHYRQFKIQMVTNEPSPIMMNRTLDGVWKIVERGERKISDQGFLELQTAIEAKLDKFIGVEHMLVLTDFSDAAQNACMYAAALSRQLKTTNLMLYHSHAAVLLPPTGFAPVIPKVTESSKDSLEKLTNLKNMLQPLVSSKTEIKIQSDERTLLAAVNMLVQQQRAGLVVVGITGRSKLERALIGSHTLDLAKDSLAPLLIVPPGAVFKKIEKIVFACDLKKVTESTPVYEIKGFVDALGATLFILNVDRDGARFNPDTIKEIHDLHKLWDGGTPEYHYTDHEDTATGIMEFADKINADLVITVPKAYGFFESILHRSLTQKLAYHTHLPLLLFKEEQ
ncbi:MAG: universal stress protein [Candidatus Pedobacter colombiensis]|uniref:Universal stress protein n=1 Tax=Candidatus Pedobacter colombiensis TaxID=3121371 RepID=A0AAJ6B8J8_9SPHI|nr:universal stress protein [Pedobacter sp.]WEK21435.1 MAG: universal stress protein [Pedobacter sp.]